MSARLSTLWKIYHKQLEFVILSEKKSTAEARQQFFLYGSVFLQILQFFF